MRDLLAKSISTSNHMFGRAIWDKLPKCIVENFEIAWVKQGQLQNFKKITSMIYSKSCLNQLCDYWLNTPKQQTLWSETNKLSLHNDQLQISEWAIRKQLVITK